MRRLAKRPLLPGGASLVESDMANAQPVRPPWRVGADTEVLKYACQIFGNLFFFALHGPVLMYNNVMKDDEPGVKHNTGSAGGFSPYQPQPTNQDGRTLEWASDGVKEDRGVVLAAVGKGWPLKRVPEEMQGDREIVMAAVRQDVWALEHAAQEMKDDKDIVLAAVKQDGWALSFASARLRNNSEEWRIVKDEGSRLDRCWSGLK